jgi:hypothetical protein
MRLIGTGQIVPDLACLWKIEMTQDDPWQAHNVVLSALQSAHQVKSFHLSRVVTVEQGSSAVTTATEEMRNNVRSLGYRFCSDSGPRCEQITTPFEPT